MNMTISDEIFIFKALVPGDVTISVGVDDEGNPLSGRIFEVTNNGRLGWPISISVEVVLEMVGPFSHWWECRARVRPCLRQQHWRWWRSLCVQW